MFIDVFHDYAATPKNRKEARRSFLLNLLPH